MLRVSRIALLSPLLLCACRREPPALPKPDPNAINVLLISIDTLRADHLNCYGYEERRVSPNVDALAADGILFEHYISASPWTTPAHMSLITSLYPSSHGLIESFMDMMTEMEAGGGFTKLPDARVTLAEVLRGAGFDTAAFTAGGTLDPRLGFDQGFDEYKISMYKLRENNVSEMLDWMGYHRDAPFFLFWHTFEVHAPYIRPEFLPEVVAADTARAIGSELRELDSDLPTEHPSLNDHIGNVHAVPNLLKQHGQYNAKVTRALYDGGVKNMDRWIGRVCDRLKELDLYDRTLIVFTSDHGDELGDRSPERIYDFHGHSVYREIVRVPLIIKLPGRKFAGTRVGALARTIDVMPTLMDVLDIDDETNQMEGASLRPLWESGARESDRIAFSEGAAQPYEVKSIRTDRYKFMVLIPPDIVQAHGRRYLPPEIERRGLYDLVADPGETKNLMVPGASVPPGVAESLERRLREFVETSQGVADRVELDEETLKRLRALGYVK